MKQTIRGPYNVELVLDPDEINFDNPGDGTPAIVKYRGGTATYWCAVGEGEVDAGEIIILPQRVVNWLNDQEHLIEEMYDEVENERKTR